MKRVFKFLIFSSQKEQIRQNIIQKPYKDSIGQPFEQVAAIEQKFCADFCISLIPFRYRVYRRVKGVKHVTWKFNSIYCPQYS